MITPETLFPNLERIFALRVSGDEDIPNGGIGRQAHLHG